MRLGTALLLAFVGMLPGCRDQKTDARRDALVRLATERAAALEAHDARLVKRIEIPGGRVTARIPADWVCDGETGEATRLTCRNPHRTQHASWEVRALRDESIIRAERSRLDEFDRTPHSKEGSCSGSRWVSVADTTGSFVECEFAGKGPQPVNFRYEGLSPPGETPVRKLTVSAPKADRQLSLAIIYSTVALPAGR